MRTMVWTLLTVLVAFGTFGYCAEPAFNAVYSGFPSDKPVRCGDVYILGRQSPERVSELLARVDLKADRAWVDTVELSEPYEVSLGYQRYQYCHAGRLITYQTSVKFMAKHGTTYTVRGEQELAAILNRPVTGLISNRVAEQQVVQNRRQVSTASEASRRDQTSVAACVATKVLKDPEMRLYGYSIADPIALTKYAESFLRGSNLKVDKTEIDKTTGEFCVYFKGEIPVESRFRAFVTGDSASFAEGGFYLGREILLKYPIAAR
jgi:hypothetical protein